MRHRNPEDRLRRYERAAAAGDPQAMLAYHKELWRTGKAIPAYAGQLLERFRDDVLRNQGVDYTDPAVEFKDRGFWDHGSPWISAGYGNSPGHAAYMDAPDRFGRPKGYRIWVKVSKERRDWAGSSVTRSIQDSLRARKAKKDLLPYTMIQVGIRLRDPVDPWDGVVHPLYYFFGNNLRFDRYSRYYARSDLRRGSHEWSTERWIPPRFETDNLLVLDFQDEATGFRALVSALTEVFDLMEGRLQAVDRILNKVTSRTGLPVTPEAAAALVREDNPGRISGLQDAVRTLWVPFGPEVGAAAPGPLRPTVRAWNAGGDGILEAGLKSLGEWLMRNHRAVVGGGADPYDNEKGYFTSGGLVVTSRRARRTRYPLEIDARFDRVMGLWDDRNWAGNEIPPDGLWRISFVNSPATVQDLYKPTVAWIKSVFPGARIEVAAWWEPGTIRPDYRPL